MRGDRGYIKLYRSITEWRWYSDPVMFRVFVHLLLTANYEPHDWRDITVRRGQRVTSVQHLAGELGYSKETVRYALKRLVNSGEITTSATNRYTVITLKNYDFYQGNSEQITGRAQTDNRQITDKRGTIKEIKEEKETREGEERTADDPTADGQSAGDLQPYPADKEQPDEKSLIGKYGEETVKRYEQRFESWCKRKGATLPLYPTIERWIERDGVKPLREREREAGSSLDLTEIDRQILEFYE